ncbi:TY-Chap domain-containing protein [Gordonia insulae]|uniref:TY-Chap N-terminal domain-containing protein n=1 Tax=Gordonia insulae TaxID=2420509 RepID=A0A3G8JRI3_9ACTN|nr:hypothetical protein [Gordonia insulae]AZG47139.1 hypothetical protein D7316_03747 [Gordonia insulae]
MPTNGFDHTTDVAWQEFSALIAGRCADLQQGQFLEIAQPDSTGWHSLLEVTVTGSGRVRCTISGMAIKWRSKEQWDGTRIELTDLGWQWLPRKLEWIHEVGRRRVDDLAELMALSLQQIWQFTHPADISVHDPFGPRPQAQAPAPPPARPVRHLWAVPDLVEED